VDARRARSFGATGIGLCRTEHMFFEPSRLETVREMILATSPAERKTALDKLLPMQRQDFIEIFEAMEGFPVTIRLLDPPLHEFLPKHADIEEELRTTEPGSSRVAVLQATLKRVKELKEENPMLGLRGCRLGITVPEITRMQARAILEAATEMVKRRKKVTPEIMVPLTGAAEELHRQKILIDEVAKDVARETGVSVEYLVGTMIEVPRAALVAEEMAKYADFFSFGTNDLTQLTFGYSRDDSGKFLPEYVTSGILRHDPFVNLDPVGVGELVRIATERGRKGNPRLEVGACGEHGGDAPSIAFFESVGLDYVSCSPFRVLPARLAAAQAAMTKSTVVANTL
jgi:pyruvate, orthophosphate dikinase